MPSHSVSTALQNQKLINWVEAEYRLIMMRDVILRTEVTVYQPLLPVLAWHAALSYQSFLAWNLSEIISITSRGPSQYHRACVVFSIV